MVTQLSSDEFEKLIKEKGTVLIDVREKYEFDAGHIKGAHQISSIRFDEGFENLGVKKKDKIALYCRSGNRSDFIASKLSQEGYPNVYNLELGILDWTRYGKQIVK